MQGSIQLKKEVDTYGTVSYCAYYADVWYAPGSVVLQFVLLTGSPTVSMSLTPPEARPLASDIIARNLLPFGNGIWAWNEPLPFT